MSRFIHKDVKCIKNLIWSIFYAFLKFKTVKHVGTSKLDSIPKFFIIKMMNFVVNFVV